jgi:hypothetical protein
MTAEGCDFPAPRGICPRHRVNSVLNQFAVFFVPVSINLIEKRSTVTRASDHTSYHFFLAILPLSPAEIVLKMSGSWSATVIWWIAVVLLWLACIIISSISAIWAVTWSRRAIALTNEYCDAVHADPATPLPSLAPWRLPAQPQYARRRSRMPPFPGFS